MSRIRSCFQNLKQLIGRIIGIDNILFRCFRKYFGRMVVFGSLFGWHADGENQTEENLNTTDNDSHTGQSTDQDQPYAIDPEELRSRLQDARVEYPPESHQFFVPNSAKDAIITEEVIAREIFAARPKLGFSGAKDLAKQVLEEARNLFATLAYLRKGKAICEFLEEGITDEDLPFERSKHKDRKCRFSLLRKDGKQIKALDEWKPSDLESLGRKQWHMIAPVFTDDMGHYELPWNTVLPFMIKEGEGEDEREGKGERDDPTHTSAGAYSEVFTTCIHTAHHEFHRYWLPTDQEHNVAIKRLHNHDEKEFDKERSILATLGKKRTASPHLVKLLATYEHQNKYHFIFPKADCNLRKYWSNNPSPSATDRLFLWALKQMAGIATALNTVHNFRVTVPLDGKGRTSTGEVEYSVKKGEELFGRHGDIKPENILWFQRIPEHLFHPDTGADDQELGILQITDFGLGRFHGRDSKTEPQPNGVFGSPTYEPPECRLHKPVSRAYDLWSLGCLYLEFATWLVMGSGAIEGFSDHRGRPSSIDPKFTEDYFFTVMRNEAGEESANVREGVTEWAQQLHAHAKCSKFIHDLVDLVMRDLLIIDARSRIDTPELCVRFGGFLQKAQEDPTYLCEPDPRPIEHILRLMPAPKREYRTSPKNPTSPKKTVSFKDGGSPTKHKQSEPRDLVLRNAGTPAIANESQI